jgi:exonuclease SbcC
MQPIALELQAFGPFAQHQRLEFDALHEHGLYLICGPTGAGKSTLLDAITFALYGESSGRERSAEEMRSDHAADDQETRVTFDFRLGEHAWRVTRTPRWERPKRRGQGTTSVAAEAALYRLEPDDAGWRLGACTESRPRTVNDAIETMLGFSAAQFRQVILLPQGQFRALLSASTEARERILEQLFDTSEHAALQHRLREHANELQRRYTAAGARASTVLETVAAQTVEALRERQGERAGTLARLAASASDARLRETAARAALDGARERNEKITRLLAARATVARLDARAEQIDRARARLDKLRAALALTDLAQAQTHAGQVRDAAARELQEARRAASVAHRTADEAAQQLDALTADGPRREAMAATVRELEAAAEAVTRWTHATSEHATTTSALAQVRRRQAQLDTEADEAAVKHAALTEEIATLRETAGGEEAAALRREAARRQLADHRDACAAATAAQKLAGDVETAARQHDTALRSRDNAATALEQMRADFIASQSRLLAESLTSGAPCPVCGATDHPAPAGGEGRVVRAEDVDAARQTLDDYDAATREPAERLAALQQALAEQRARVPTEFDPAHEPRLAEAVDTAERALAVARQARQTLAAKQTELERLDTTIARLRRARDDAAAEIAAAADAESRARATLETREEALPAGLRSTEAVQTALEEARASHQAAIAALERAQQRAQAAQQDATRAAAALAGAERRQQEAEQHHTEATVSLENRVAQAGFASVEDFRPWLARTAEVDPLTRQITEHDDQLKAARAVLDSIEGDLGEAAQADLAPLQRALADATATREHIEAEQVREEEARKQEAKALERLADIERERTALDAEHAVFGSLATVANDRAMTFQRHVLAVLLDRVLLLASVHLQRMSRGRYELLRSLETRDARTHHGLDLEVEDAYTGKRRSVGTLSGGEGFMTALALALGLSETVQHLAGGVRLDALFIDEGFGSLDEEALDLAIDTLLGLRAAGRTVGVISHVPEMRQRLDARIDVIKRQDGSTLRRVLP